MHKIGEVIDFGEKLIATQDLDPCYVALTGAMNEFGKGQLKRLLLAYFCFYHLGSAAYLSEWEGEEFWMLMENAASNEIPPNMNGELPGERWPRGSERRHFRGQKCVDAVQTMQKFSEGKTESGVGPGAEHIVGLWFELSQLITFDAFLRSVQTMPMMGPWISFKVADVMERVMGAHIEFPNDILTFYKEPRAALDLLDIPAEAAAEKLRLHFRKFVAPPSLEGRKGRRCNIQEIETIACKWKSSVGGHYWIGKDIHEIRKGLAGWGETADKLLKHMPREVSAGLFA